MSDTFKEIVRETVEQNTALESEKVSLYKDLYNYIEQSYVSFLDDGYSEKEAEKKAIQSFHNYIHTNYRMKKMTRPIQQQLLFTLALSSIIYSFFIYLVQLFNNGDAHILWLITSVSINVVVLLIVYKVIEVDSNWFVNCLLIVHTIIYFFGLGLALSIDHFLIAMLSIYNVLLMLLAIILIYLNVIFHLDMENIEKGFHLYNMTLGIIIIIFNYFLILLYLLFSADVAGGILLLTLPTFIWGLLYFIQIQLIHKTRIKIAVSIAIIPFLFVSACLWFSFSV